MSYMSEYWYSIGKRTSSDNTKPVKFGCRDLSSVQYDDKYSQLEKHLDLHFALRIDLYAKLYTYILEKHQGIICSSRPPAFSMGARNQESR